jgi:hypothetical protein
MSPDAIESLFKLIAPIAVIWLTWVTVSHWKTKSELDALKLYVAENYAKNDALKAIDTKLDAISGMVHTLVGRLGITVTKE